jgi:hypothetical protein
MYKHYYFSLITSKPIKQRVQWTARMCIWCTIRNGFRYGEYAERYAGESAEMRARVCVRVCVCVCTCGWVGGSYGKCPLFCRILSKTKNYGSNNVFAHFYSKVCKNLPRFSRDVNRSTHIFPSIF